MKRIAKDLDGTHFLNVDLDIFSKEPLDPLVAALGKRVFVHYVGREGRKYSAHLSLASCGQSAEFLTRSLVRRIVRLPRGARRMWNAAATREFNIGIQAGPRPSSHEIRLNPETVALVASVRGSIVITTYAPDAAPSSSPELPEPARLLR